MDISEQNLSDFRAWLTRRGRETETARIYSLHLATCAKDPKGLTHRLVSRSLAPNTKHGIKAALRAWATFSDDDRLAKELADIRLPAPRRQRHKNPLTEAEWKTAVSHLRKARMTNKALRQVLILLSTRGFRSGDVLRMQRTEIVRALDTGKLIYVGKGNKRLEFATESIREPLEALAEIKGWVHIRDLITTSKDPRVASNKVWRASRRTAKKVGILEMNPHRYRHTFATHFLGKLSGDPNAIVKLQHYMGWENMATAARYVDRVSQDELDAIGTKMVADVLGPSEPPRRRRSR
jgi:integrase